MSRIITLILAIVVIMPIRLNATEPLVQRFEGEIFGGFTLPLESYHGGKPQISGTLGIEGRFNIPKTQWDCGLMACLSTARHGYNHQFDDNYNRWQNNRTFAIAAVCHYNFCQGKKINPYLGCALGLAFNDVVGDRYFPTKYVSMLFAPRFGVEIIHHIRITGQFNICRKGYNNFSLAIGFVLGGYTKTPK